MAKPIATVEDPIESIEDEDVLLDDEDLEDDVEDVEDDVEEDVEEDADEDDEEADEGDSKELTKKANTEKPLFDKKQQAEVNKLIKARLERQETTLTRDLTKAAGVEITHDEITNAARLWGLLKTNPKLSGDVDALIAVAIEKGDAKAPKTDGSMDAITQRLELKEAILDLKADDATFGKNATKILEWAENEGYEITNAKSLKMAYLAWKGSQGKIADAVQKTTAKRKQETKKALQKRATMQSPKSGTKRASGTDYRRMSDDAVLASEGLSLFTDD
jgi:hypothetical protein